MSKTPEFKAWCKMKERCLNPNDKSYPNYGGNGVTIHTDFINSFEKFFEEVGERPSSKHSLDKINNELGYTYGNLRWATSTQQNRNNSKCKVNKSGVTGVYLDRKTSHKGKYETFYWVAKYVDLDRKSKQVAYSVKKYGDELAKFLAEETRDLAMQYLNNNGAGYTEHHGK